MGWQLAPLGRYLDVRPGRDFQVEPMSEAVNIPFAELPKRLHELPPKGEAVLILDTCPEAEQAVSFLRQGGRVARLKQPSPPTPSPLSLREKGEGTNRLWRPNAFLEGTLGRLSPGRALDLGCGAGREAVAMAGAGFQVTAVDNLPDALELGRDLAWRYLSRKIEGDAPSPRGRGTVNEVNGGEWVAEPSIEWICTDLETNPAAGPSPYFLETRGGSWSLITSFRYLHRPLLARIHEWLAPGGSLLLETFTSLHRERHGKPRQDAHILQLGEAPSLVPGLETVEFDEAWRGDAHTARLWARKSR